MSPASRRNGLADICGGRARGAEVSTVAIRGDHNWLAGQFHRLHFLRESRLAGGSGELTAGGVDVAAASEADGGGETVLGEDRPEALVPLRRGAVVASG